MRNLRTCLAFSVTVLAALGPVPLAMAAESASSGAPSPVALTAPPILALNPQPEPPGFWDLAHKRFVPLSLLPPGPCRTKVYFEKNTTFCEAHLLTRPQPT